MSVVVAFGVAMGMIVGMIVGVFVVSDVGMSLGMVAMNMMIVVGGTSEEAAYLVRSHEGDYLSALLEGKLHVFKMMRLHYGEHHFLVYRQRHVDFSAFYHSRPVLIANGMAELHTATDNFFRALLGKAVEVNDEHRVQFQAKHDEMALLRGEADDVAVYYLCLAREGHGIFVALVARGEETRFLCRPLVEIYRLYMQTLKTLTPFGSVDIA